MLLLMFSVCCEGECFHLSKENLSPSFSIIVIATSNSCSVPSSYCVNYILWTLLRKCFVGYYKQLNKVLFELPKSCTFQTLLKGIYFRKSAMYVCITVTYDHHTCSLGKFHAALRLQSVFICIQRSLTAWITIVLNSEIYFHWTTLLSCIVAWSSSCFLDLVSSRVWELSILLVAPVELSPLHSSKLIRAAVVPSLESAVISWNSRTLRGCVGQFLETSIKCELNGINFQTKFW